MTSYIDAISPTLAIIGRLKTISGYHDIHMAAVYFSVSLLNIGYV